MSFNNRSEDERAPIGEQRWLIYRCLDPECGTLIYAGVRSDQPPEDTRTCLDCGGAAALQEQPRPQKRRGYTGS